MAPARIVVRGGGELGTAAARLLFLSGSAVVVLERLEPLAVRRLVSFAEAVISGHAVVEGVRGRRVGVDEAAALRAEVAVVVDPDGTALPRLRPDVLVDARMLKRGHTTSRRDAPLVVGLGPGLTAGVDVHAVVETQRGPDLGRVIWSGAAEADSAIPAAVLGHTEARVVRAPRAGAFQAAARIGDLVTEGQVLGSIDGASVSAAIAGIVRGLIADGVTVGAGIKIGDIDPRGAAVDPARISDKARAVAAGVLEAIAVGRARTAGSGAVPMLR
jgi:xanthine dehydrogenase accessory factor